MQPSRQSRRSRRADLEIPRPPIELVLAELSGCDPSDIPTGYGWVRCRCPFHDDRTPSASVNHDPDEGGFNCHSCGRKGDGLKLLQQERHLEWKEACDLARELAGEQHRPGARHSRKTKNRRASDLL